MKTALLITIVFFAAQNVIFGRGIMCFKTDLEDRQQGFFDGLFSYPKRANASRHYKAGLKQAQHDLKQQEMARNYEATAVAEHYSEAREIK